MDIGPAFSKKWEEFYADVPDKPVIWLGPLAQCVPLLADA